MPTKRTIGTMITSATRSVAFDRTSSDTWAGEVEWTESPVSPNRKTQDHGTLAQKTFDVEGEISATTLGPILASEPMRLEILRDELMAMRDERLPCTIVNGFHVKEDYVIKSLRMTRTAPSGNTMQVSIAFVQLETTESRSTTIPATAVFATVESDFGPLDVKGIPANEEEMLADASEAEEVRTFDNALGVDITGYASRLGGELNRWSPV